MGGWGVSQITISKSIFLKGFIKDTISVAPPAEGRRRRHCLCSRPKAGLTISISSGGNCLCSRPDRGLTISLVFLAGRRWELSLQLAEPRPHYFSGVRRPAAGILCNRPSRGLTISNSEYFRERGGVCSHRTHYTPVACSVILGFGISVWKLRPPQQGDDYNSEGKIIRIGSSHNVCIVRVEPCYHVKVANFSKVSGDRSVAGPSPTDD